MEPPRGLGPVKPNRFNTCTASVSRSVHLSINKIGKVAKNVFSKIKEAWHKACDFIRTIGQPRLHKRKIVILYSGEFDALNKARGRQPASIRRKRPKHTPKSPFAESIKDTYTLERSTLTPSINSLRVFTGAVLEPMITGSITTLAGNLDEKSRKELGGAVSHLLGKKLDVISENIDKRYQEIFSTVVNELSSKLPGAKKVEAPAQQAPVEQPAAAPAEPNAEPAAEAEDNKPAIPAIEPVKVFANDEQFYTAFVDRLTEFVLPSSHSNVLLYILSELPGDATQFADLKEDLRGLANTRSIVSNINIWRTNDSDEPGSEKYLPRIKKNLEGLVKIAFEKIIKIENLNVLIRTKFLPLATEIIKETIVNERKAQEAARGAEQNSETEGVLSSDEEERVQEGPEQAQPAGQAPPVITTHKGAYERFIHYILYDVGQFNRGGNKGIMSWIASFFVPSLIKDISKTMCESMDVYNKNHEEVLGMIVRSLMEQFPGGRVVEEQPTASAAPSKEIPQASQTTKPTLQQTLNRRDSAGLLLEPAIISYTEDGKIELRDKPMLRQVMLLVNAIQELINLKQSNLPLLKRGAFGAVRKNVFSDQWIKDLLINTIALLQDPEKNKQVIFTLAMNILEMLLSPVPAEPTEPIQDEQPTEGPADEALVNTAEKAHGQTPQSSPQLHSPSLGSKRVVQVNQDTKAP